MAVFFQAKRAISFHKTGVMRKPPWPVADFSKANWGDHIKYDSTGFPIPFHPTSNLVELINQLKPKQWEKILAAAIDESKVHLSSEDVPFFGIASSKNAISTINQPKPQLRDDDSDLE